MSKHTPGPWMQVGWGIYPEDTGNTIKVCEMNSKIDSPYNEIVANADLVARSPELLEENDRLKELNKEMMEALESVIEAMEWREGKTKKLPNDNWLFNVKEAIKKANGEI